jgi:hypothetical protein
MAALSYENTKAVVIANVVMNKYVIYCTVNACCLFPSRCFWQSRKISITNRRNSRISGFFKEFTTILNLFEKQSLWNSPKFWSLRKSKTCGTQHPLFFPKVPKYFNISQEISRVSSSKFIAIIVSPPTSWVLYDVFLLLNTIHSKW